MSITKEVKASDATAQKMFSKGTLVEVSSDDDGFEGAWLKQWERTSSLSSTRA